MPEYNLYKLMLDDAVELPQHTELESLQNSMVSNM
jgi:hypothetical protein